MIKKFIANHKVLCVIVFVAVIVHLSLFFTLKSLSKQHPNSLHHEFPIVGGGFDGIQYPTLADNIITYQNFSMEAGYNGSPETFRTPGYPFFVAVVKYFTGSMDFVPIAQIIILALAAFLVYFAILAISPEYKTIGLIVSALFLFDPIAFFSSQFIAAESMYFFTFLLCMYLLLQKTFSERVAYIFAGISFGLSALMRPSGLYMIIPIGIWMIYLFIKSKNRKRIAISAGLFCLMVVLVLSPWYIRNKVRTGVFALSSLDAYNSINFNLPVYFNYKSNYKTSIDDVRADLHNQIGNISDDEQMKLENSALIKNIVWETIKPDLFGYSIFHISKSINFFLSPGIKFSMSFLRGFFDPQPVETWHPQMSFASSVLDGRFVDAFKVIYKNILYLPESIFLLIMFISGLYWYWKKIRYSDSVKLVFLVVFFLALLTSPISNPRYRIPVVPFIYLSGIAGVFLMIDKNKSKIQ